MKNIVLIGLPMSGKSTIGEALKNKLNIELVDIDLEIEKKEGLSIPLIFEKYGEAYFREVEKERTAYFASKDNLIISTGGGVIKNEINMINLKKNGFIVYLDRDVEKMIYSTSRPLTKSKEDLLKLKEEREPLYNKWKDIKVSNSSSVTECVNKILEAYHESINN